MNRRIMHVYCMTDDGSRLEVSQDDWGAEEDDPPGYVEIRTTGGRAIHLTLKDGRDLAGWLIEHCAEDPDARDHGDGLPDQQSNALPCTIRECSGYGTVHH